MPPVIQGSDIFDQHL